MLSAGRVLSEQQSQPLLAVPGSVPSRLSCQLVDRGYTPGI